MKQSQTTEKLKKKQENEKKQKKEKKTKKEKQTRTIEKTFYHQIKRNKKQQGKP